MCLLSTTLIVLASGLYVFRLHKAHPYLQGSWRLHSSQSCSFLRRRIRYCPSFWDQEMVTKSLTTSIAGLVVACFSVHLSMVPSGFGITSGTISLSSANKRKPPALPRLRFSVSSCFPHFDPFGSTSVRSSFISSTCHFVRVSRNVLRSRLGQRADVRFLLHHNMLSYPVCATMDLSCAGVLWPRFTHAGIPLPHQGCLIDAHERHDYGTCSRLLQPATFC